MRSNIFTLILFIFSSLFGKGGSDQPSSGEKNLTKSFDKQSVVDAANSTAVNVNLSVGDCRVTCGSSNTASISADCLIRSTDQKYIDEILNRVEIKAENVNDVLNISVYDKITCTDIWQWIEKTYNNNAELVVNFDIAVPCSIHDYNVKSNVGDISLDGLDGKLNASGNVGDISISDSYIWDGSVFTANTGDIDLDFSDVDGTFSAQTFTGDVQVEFNTLTEENSSGKLTASTGNIKVITRGNGYKVLATQKNGTYVSKDILVGEKCELNMKTNVGSINVR